MKKVGLFICVAALAMLLGVVPASAGKKALSESDLDLVTAAGQPAVLIAATITYTKGPDGTAIVSTFAGNGLVSLTGNGEYSLTVGSTSQQGLRALVLNNVVGENQVANGLNIQAAPTGGTSSQSNEINQSWGSTLDVAGSDGTSATITISGKCIACVNNAGTAGGNGKIDITSTGKAIATINNAGGGSGSRRSIYADEILIGSNIWKVDTNEFNLTLTESSQAGLAALLVNNVVGLNLVANGVNIASGAISLGTDPALGNGSGIAGAGPQLGFAQTNTVRQYRGTPYACSGTASCAR